MEEIVTARIDVENGLIPSRWYGYDAATAIVLDTNDRNAMSTLDALPAASRWSTGSSAEGTWWSPWDANWQVVRDSVLAPILPGLPTGQERVTSLEALDAYRRLGQADHATGHPAGDGHEAPGGQGARRHRPGGGDVATCPWSSAAHSGSAASR